MLSSPYEIIWCSWPRPAEVEGGRWTSDPEWDAPEMTSHPGQCLEWVAGHWRWVLDWSGFLHSSLIQVDRLQRDLRGFHAVWRLRMRYSGTLVVPDGGSWIRCDGRVLHCQRRLDMPGECEVRVRAGEVLEVAQVHGEGRWRWWAGLQDEGPDNATEDPAVIMLQPYLARASAQLNGALGPPLKVFSDGRAPLRLIVAIYSMILNGGCAPVEVYLFGEHQWDDRTRALVARLLPFARVVATTTVLERLHHLGGPQLVKLANSFPEALTSAILKLYPPHEFCAMDDQVLILGSVVEAINAHMKHDYVLPHITTRRTASVFSWQKIPTEKHLLAEKLLAIPVALWEHGLAEASLISPSIAWLDQRRYIHALHDGLPGGLSGYDYANNPCGFVAITSRALAQSDELTDGAILSRIEAILCEK